MDREALDFSSTWNTMMRSIQERQLHSTVTMPQQWPAIWRYSAVAAIGASKMQQKIVGLFREDLEDLKVSFSGKG
jgi:hypothetical protein